MSKHTATPWAYDENSGYIHDGHPETGALFERASDHSTAVENCRFVVLAVNSHAQMLEALEADVAWWDFEEAGPTYPDGTTRYSEGGEAVWHKWYDECLRLCAVARNKQPAALAAVRGEESKA